jgi:hypothetical protein
LKLRALYFVNGEKALEPYINLNSDPEVMAYFPSVKTPVETLAQIKKISDYIGEFDHPLITDGQWLKRHVVYKIKSAL